MLVKPTTTKQHQNQLCKQRSTELQKRKTERGPVLFNGTVGTSGYIYVYLYVYVYVYVHVYVHVYVYVYVYVYVCRYVCMYVCIYIYIYICIYFLSLSLYMYIYKQTVPSSLGLSSLFPPTRYPIYHYPLFRTNTQLTKQSKHPLLRPCLSHVSRHPSPRCCPRLCSASILPLRSNDRQ